MRASSSKKSHFSGRRLGQLQTLMERPMDAFKERVSQGTADLGTAKAFLNIQYRACLASPAPMPRAAMQSSGAAPTILQWLWSSGMEDTGEFLTDQEFVAHLVPFLIAEGRQPRILRWLHRFHNPEEKPFPSLRGLETCLIKGFLFARMIEAEAKIGDGLESAITLFIRSLDGLRSSGSTKRSLQNGAIRAAWMLTKSILRLQKAARPEPSNIQSFLEKMRTFDADPLLSATLSIYISERRDPQPALTYLQNTFPKALVNRNAGQWSHIVHLGLRAAELFLRDGRQTEALWIMGFLQENFALELASRPDPTRKVRASGQPEMMSRTEEDSLLLLDTLTAQ